MRFSFKLLNNDIYLFRQLNGIWGMETHPTIGMTFLPDVSINNKAQNKEIDITCPVRALQIKIPKNDF